MSGRFWVADALIDDFTLGRLGPMPFCVYIALLRHVNKAGVCRPSVAKLASETGIHSRTTITRCLGVLESAGLISCERKNGAVNKYLVSRGGGDPATSPSPGLVAAGVEGKPVHLLDTTSPSAGHEPVHLLVTKEYTRRNTQEGRSVSGKPETQKPKNRKRKPLEYTAEFEDAWSTYPRRDNGRKGNKSEAYTAWQKLDADEQSLVARAIPIYATNLNGDFPKDMSRFIAKCIYVDHQEPDLDRPLSEDDVLEVAGQKLKEQFDAKFGPPE